MHKNSLSIARIDDSQADLLISQFSDVSWRQCPSYSKAAAQQIGATSEYMHITDGGQTVALANVRIKKIPATGTGIAFISHGPMLHPDNQNANDGRDRAILELLVQYYVRERKLCLRFEPHNYEGGGSHLKMAALDTGFQPLSAPPYQTFVLDISQDLETLRKNLNGKWRTDLNRGERSNLRLTCSGDAADFDRFAPLLEDLARKKGFSAPQDTNFYKSVAAHAGHNDRIKVHLAWDGDEVVGGHIGSYSGDTAVYLLGATPGKGRDLRASYVLQWEVIKYAKSLGLSRYDLGGVNKAENPAVYRFKKRMGGDYVVADAGYEIYPQQPYAALIKSAETIYRKLRG